MTTRYSIIIPTLNEEARIGTCLAQVRDVLGFEGEIIVADGGSSDATHEIALCYGATVCHSQRGRGTQCNVGAAHASGDVLLFLYADTVLPPNAFAILHNYFSREHVHIGSFCLAFDTRHPLLDPAPFFSSFDTIFTRFGDQCIVVRRSLFDALGGFPDYPLFEDVAFLERARARTPIYSFPTCVTTSARRYIARGVLENHLYNVWLIVRYLLGASPHNLAREYWHNSQQR